MIGKIPGEKLKQWREEQHALLTQMLRSGTTSRWPFKQAICQPGNASKKSFGFFDKFLAPFYFIEKVFPKSHGHYEFTAFEDKLVLKWNGVSPRNFHAKKTVLFRI
jgi:hypothetical protein